jgi:adenylate kinase
LGKLTKPYVQSGKLVPDDLVNELVADRFRRSDRPENFVMDGYPRTLAQAASFDQALRQSLLPLDAVVLLVVDDKEIIRRLSGRWSCPNTACGATYHITNKPPKRPGVCDVCGSSLVQRIDDREDTIRERLRVYRQNTTELIPHYRAQGLLREIDGEGDLETIYQHIIAAAQHK